MSDKNIDKLIIKFVENTATLDEQVELKQLLEIEGNRAYFDEYVELNYLINSKVKFDYNNTLEEVMGKIESKPKSLIMYKYLKYAAAIILLISTGYFLTKNQVKTTSKVVIDNKIPIGTDKATLTLGDGSVVVLEKGKKFNNTNAKSDGEKIVYSTVDESKNEKVEEITYNYLTIPRGGQFYIELADGTAVWLNSDTKLKYPTKFINGEPRKVELIYGEAYFDVSPSSKHNGAIFQVNNGNQNIEVLGTEFNIKNYKNDNFIETTLVEGKISLEVDNEKDILLPNDQLTYNIDSNNIEKRIVDVYDIISWKEGLFIFEDKSLLEACKLMSRWYDVDFVIENEELENILLSGQINKNQKIEHILTTLKNIKNISYEIKGDKIYLN